MRQHDEPPISKLERARNIASHLVIALGDDVPIKDAIAMRDAVDKIAVTLNEAYMKEFRKANPDFVKQEEQSRKDRETFEKNEILRVQAEKEREENNKRTAEEEKRRKDNEI